MDQSAPIHTEVLDAAARVRAIRSRLPGQMQKTRLERAALEYGPLYTLTEMRARIGETLPWRFGYVRGATLVPIETYRGAIPDDALLKYDDAVKTGLFSRFLVATPTYYQERQLDPWIVAEVAGADRWAVLAQWVDPME
jgi:hypothetical protein